MFIRRKPNKSGAFSVQVLDKRRGRNVLLRSFGSSKDETELLAMEQMAADFIAGYGGQGVIEFEEVLSSSAEEEAEMFFSRIIDVRQDAPRIIMSRVYDGIGFGAIGDDTLPFIGHCKGLRAKEQGCDCGVSQALLPRRLPSPSDLPLHGHAI